ncbi:PAS-domain containing protein [Wenzhouxiangella limi]|uniref:PAS-domain containing protein n=1 Tax=Wenzhouxiangella limi TaxID=2707351 RepID=UPI00194440ED
MLTLSTATIVLAGLAWLGLLFAVALYGERTRALTQQAWPVIYSLSLAVYCTAWTFYGTTTQAARSGWLMPPTFIGTIVLFVFAFPFLLKLVRLSKAENSTSIADFIASRFGKSSALAGTVTAVAVLGMVPYIALQLKAVAMSFGALTRGTVAESELVTWLDLAFYVAVFMAVFAMLFGTRRASSTEHNQGLVVAMGFESLLKLGAMLALGGFVVFGLYDGLDDVAAGTTLPPFANADNFFTLSLLGALAMFTLPHQFHIGVVECRDEAHLRVARWLFPLFLVLISLPIVPLALAGNALLAAQGTPPDLYVLLLPLLDGQNGLALFAFLGGLSAATGMVVLASLTLSIMIGNHWLTPALVNRGWAEVRERGIPVRLQRRLGIAVVLLLAYVYGRLVGTAEPLADIGGLSFSVLAQLAPAVMLAVYRPGLPAAAILTGVLAGVLVWAYVLFVPLLAGAAAPPWISEGPLGLSLLAPAQLFGLGGLDPLSRAVLVSLMINTAVTLLLARSLPGTRQGSDQERPLEPALLRQLAARFLPSRRVEVLFASTAGPETLESRLELELAAVVGSASASLLLDAARKRTPAPLDTVAELVGEAAAQARFSQEVLSGALENMSQGVCVVDRQMRLVAWNQAYLALFSYPDELIRVGRPVADLLRYNAGQGLLDGSGDVEARIQRRLSFKQQGSRHRIERPWPDGRIIEIRGNPMPGGGFVATFSDVTAFRRTAEELRQVNETLEQRVLARTAELEQAKVEAERASEAKTRFLAAVSHDLVQPLNAAQLLTHSLREQLGGHSGLEPLGQISGALAATERLLEGLLDISRLDAGGLHPRITRFPLDELFAQLYGEFSVLARQRGLRLDYVPTKAWVESDPQLLRRILQNFLSNAVRYTRSGRILIGARRRGSRVLAGVWDTGDGIAEHQRDEIFEEFRRLGADQHAPGLGLGLAIADRMARLLDHELILSSQPGRGAMFGVCVNTTTPVTAAPGVRDIDTTPATASVLVVDNDSSMLQSLQSLLVGWGFYVSTSASAEKAETLVGENAFALLLLDYHLDGGDSGLALLRRLRAGGCRAPVILISADHTADLKNAAAEAGCDLLHKPLRPLALRSLINRLIAERL